MEGERRKEEREEGERRERGEREMEEGGRERRKEEGEEEERRKEERERRKEEREEEGGGLGRHNTDCMMRNNVNADCVLEMRDGLMLIDQIRWDKRVVEGQASCADCEDYDA